MSEEDFLPPEDEEPPEHLQRKWDKEEYYEEKEGELQKCPHCGKMNPARQFSCVYCGERIMQKAGFLSGLLHFFLHSNWSLFFILVLLAGLFFLFIF